LINQTNITKKLSYRIVLFILPAHLEDQSSISKCEKHLYLVGRKISGLPVFTVWQGEKKLRDKKNFQPTPTNVLSNQIME